MFFAMIRHIIDFPCAFSGDLGPGCQSKKFGYSFAPFAPLREARFTVLIMRYALCAMLHASLLYSPLREEGSLCGVIS
jgi:hypothetical protein